MLAGSADTARDQQLLTELAVFYAQLEASSQVSSEHVQAAVCMQSSMTRAESGIDTAPKAAAAPALIRWPHTRWTVFREKLADRFAALEPVVQDAWQRVTTRRWTPTRRGYIAAGAAAAAISGLVAIGSRFGASMATRPEPTAPVAIVDPVPAPVTPAPPELSPPDKPEATAAAPAQPAHGRRRRRTHHRPSGG